QAGVFEGVRGILLGEFLNCQAPAGAAYGVEEVLRERLEPLGVPILAGLPVGHGARNWPLKLGAARLWEGGVVEV
ncbi:MAG TPA: LD-carboxypeptidase, partial [Myxococcota bacterium]|nr:LD-carboxypeptidase [Myxococcota bacterium]